tara:strand:- start:972 stop:2351 length:1380 start_codon:yes stop_codon:yes gene_type:complete
MATMNFDIASKGDARVAIFLKKCKEGIKHDLANGSSASGKSVKLTHIAAKHSPDKKLLIKSQKVEKLSSMLYPSGASVFYFDSDGNKYTLSNLHKSDDYKDGKTTFNKGNVAEILFAGAIFLRFKSKATRIDSNQIKRLIESLPAKSNTGRVSVLSDNLDPDSQQVLKKPKDAIHFIYGLSMNNYLAVKDMTLWSAWSKILKGAVTYANSIEVSRHADMFYKNGLKNRIVIFADGETDQKGTKVDVRVTANNHKGEEVPLDLNISLKAGPVKQFGQYGGTKYSVQEKLWKEFFGIDIKNLYTKDSFYGMMGTENHDKDMAEALNMSYAKVAPKVAEALGTVKGLDKFFKAVNFHMTRKENPVFLIQLDDKGQAIKYDTSNIKEALKGLTFTSKLEKSGTLPMMRICTTIDGKENTFLDIRVKRGDYSDDGTPYYRNIFEKGKHFTKTLSTIIEDKLVDE